MITVTYNDKGFRINTRLLKAKLKKRFLNTMTLLAIVLGIIGGCFIAGIAGASDIGNANILQVITRTAQGICLFGMSYALIFVRNALQ